MNKIISISVNTYKEGIRNKILYTSFFAALMLIFFSFYLGDWSLYYREETIQLFSLSIIQIICVFLSIYIGVSFFQKELLYKTLHVTLIHSVKRWQFILGKFLGYQFIILLNLLILFSLLLILLFISGIGINFKILNCLFFIYLECLLILSVALLFSTFSTPFLSGWFAFGVYAIGHWTGDFAKAKELIEGEMGAEASTYSNWIYQIADTFQVLVPNLERLNIKYKVVSGLEIPFSMLMVNTFYVFCYTGIFLMVSCIWFQRRDLT